MVFALGALTASLIALGLLGAVWKRAVRLTTKRVQAMTPLSMAEIKAEKDQVRAEAALAVRGVEIRLERLAEKSAQQTVEAGRLTEDIHDKARTLAARQEEIAALRDVQATLERELAAARATIDARDETIRIDAEVLRDKEAELAALDRSFEAKSRENDEQRVEIVALKTEVDNLRSQVTVLGKGLATAEGDLGGLKLVFAETTETLTGERRRLADTEADLSATRAARDAALARIVDLDREVARLDAALADQTRTRVSVEAERDQTAGDLEQTRARVEMMAQDIVALTARVEAAMAQVAEETRARDKAETAFAAAERKADALARGLEKAQALQQATGTELESLRAELNVATGALVAARAERETLQKQVGSRRSAPPKGGMAEQALLRAALTDMAARVVAATALREGPSSPLHALVDPPSDGGQDATAPSPLVKRIRTLKAKPSPQA